HCDPAQRLALESSRFAGKRDDMPQVQQDAAIVVMMLEGDQRLRLLDVYAEFFEQLAPQSVQRGLLWLQLATGEFPAARQMLAWRTLGDQHATGRVEQRAGHHVDDAHVCLALAGQHSMT